MVLAYAGGDRVQNGVIDVDGDNADYSSVRQLGPIWRSVYGDFEFTLPLEYTDGPASSTCPNTNDGSYDSLIVPGATGNVLSRFDSVPSVGHYCIQSGDVLTVEYTDPLDTTGNATKVTYSATFAL